MIVGFLGFIDSGKNTAADFLVNNFDFQRISFADTLKDTLASIFDWDRNLLEGITEQSRKWREEIDAWWANRLNIPNFSPRWALQYFGTSVFRNTFHQDIWIASLEKKMSKIKKNVVISDVRFPNEINFIRSLDGFLIRIKKGQDPEWYQDAINQNAGPQNMSWLISKNKLKMLGVEYSETAWIGSKIDHIIENNGSLENLHDCVRGLVECRL